MKEGPSRNDGLGCNWYDQSSPPGILKVIAMIRVSRGLRKCGNDWTYGVLIGGRRGRRVKGEKCVPEHKLLFQVIDILSTVLCSTGTILRRKGNEKGQK